MMLEPKDHEVNALEADVQRLASRTGARSCDWARFMGLMAPLRSHSVSMYTHTLRVGRDTCELILESGNGQDPRYGLYSGSGHDIGKCDIPANILHSDDLEPAEFEQVKCHAETGYERLKEDFPLTALAVGLHHHPQPGGYGINPEMVEALADDSVEKMVFDMACLINLTDFADALMTRRNARTYRLCENPDDPEAVKATLCERFPDREAEISWIVTKRMVLGNDTICKVGIHVPEHLRNTSTKTKIGARVA